MRVLLVSPKLERPVSPGDHRDKISLLYLGAMLEKHNIVVKIIDRHVDNIKNKEFIQIIHEFNPQVIGLSVVTETIADTINCCQIIHKKFPNIKIILGGQHVSLAAEDFLRHVPEAEFILRGEAEESLVEFVRAIEQKISPANISGLSYRTDTGQIIHNPARQFITNLDQLPFPARHLSDKYKNHRTKQYYYFDRYPGRAPVKMGTCLMISSRGCPFNCAFCASSCFWQQRWRARSVDNVVSEIAMLKKDYGVDMLEISDDAFTIDQDRAEKICREMISQKLNIRWNTHLRVDSVSYDLLKLMRDAGCYYVSYGVESGSQRILDEIVHKRLTIERIIKVTGWLDELGVLRHANFMISFPTETKADAEETIALMKKIGGKINFGVTIIYPGTQIEQIARNNGTLPADFSWINPPPAQYTIASIKQRAPFFVDTLPWEDVCHYLFSWAKNQDYNIWQHAWRAVKNIRSLEDIKKLAITGKNFLKK